MNNAKRTTTLDSFIINKLKNISIASPNPNPNVDSHTEATDINSNQHAVNSNVNDMTISLLSPENDHSSIENNRDGFYKFTTFERRESILLFC